MSKAKLRDTGMRLGSYGDRAIRQLWASDRGYLLETEMCARLDLERLSDCENALRYPVRKGMIVRDEVDGVARYLLPEWKGDDQRTPEPPPAPPVRQPAALPPAPVSQPEELPPSELREPAGEALAGFVDRMVRTTIPVGEASETAIEEFEQLLEQGPRQTDATPAQAGSREMLFAVFAGESIDQVQRKLVLTTMQRCNNVKATAARQLGVSLKTLYNWLGAYRSQGFPELEADAQPADVATSAVPPSAPTAPPPAASSFRCGLFSDGTFLFEVNGERTTLDSQQCIQLVNFVDRLALKE